MTVVRWPIQPLLDLPSVTATDVKRVLGLSGSGWKRLVAVGLTDWQADRAAIRLGTFPHYVWPGWIEAGLGPLDHHYLDQGWRQIWLWKEAS